MNSVAYDSNENYRFLKRLLRDEFGAAMSEDQEQKVTDKLDAVMTEHNIGSLQSLYEQLRKTDTSALRTDVLHAITEYNINWFSYPEITSVFVNYVLPNLAQNSDKPYRVWVVGCGRGQAAYSLAIAADRYKKKEERDLPIEIIATDTSKKAVVDAKKATFRASFLYGLDEADRSQYMTFENEEWVVNDSIKSMVSFSVANPFYLDDENPGEIDLIIAPDILAYYTVLAKSQVLELFANCLVDAGMLIVGNHEPVQPFCEQFSLVDHSSGVFYRKQE